MEDESQKKNFLSWIIPVFMVLGIILTAASAIAGEKQIEKNTNPVIIGTELDYPPYSFLDENGEPAGYNVDLTQAIARVMNLDIEVRIGPWGEIRRALETGEIDAISGMYYSAERDKVVDFSPPYTVVHHAIFVRRGTPAIETEEDLRGKEIIVMSGDIMHDYVLKKGLSDKPVLVDTQADALRLLASGEHDCALTAKLPRLYWTKELGLSNIVTVGPLLRPSNYSYAVTEGNAVLQHLLGEGLATLEKTGARKEIYDKWLGVLEPRDVPLRTVFKYIALVAVPLLLLLTIFVIWSHTLKRQVTGRTKDLRESEEKYRTILSSIEDSYFEVNQRGDITFFNESFSEITGYPPDELMGMKNDKYLDQENRKKVFNKFNEVWKTGIPTKLFEYELIRKNGEKRTVQTSASLVADGNGQKIGFRGIIRDVSDRKRMEKALGESEEKLVRSNKMEALGLLAGGVAHDLNNVLSGIVSYPEFILLDLPEDHKLRKPIETMQESGHRAAAIVQDLLTVARGVATTKESLG